MINLKLLKKSFGYAFEGIHFALGNDQNLRIHFVAAIAALLLSLYLGISTIEFAIIIVMITLVITAELINTTIEKMTDLITKEHRLEAKYAKDVASSMVLFAAIGSVLVGILIFTPYLLRMF